MKKRSNLISVGKITGVYGVKGWVKVRSDTDPDSKIFEYSPWWLKTKHGVKQVEIDDFRAQGAGFIAHIAGIDDRDEAQSLSQVAIAIERSSLPELPEGEFYWIQLHDLRVVTVFNNTERDLGIVSKVIETGANDVLSVAGDTQSIDTRERLIPYVPGQYVLNVDLEKQMITVDWDPDF
ncbi:ribosome maturation factor RimM [Marinibactrum halimedae]|uniref:Ribosome maturation factor RimM n=1 Tax=Marinibactrum halimedae TaxID=1444977 RepID=A0AA37T9L7_9GAMM|nr:ribosome maturation factor RimM [Marinibactrum halimedae]MCD9460058.1 ribosome maturation factor RimM [Marinibactrum halimedae]GLS26456.1 ribosome maturation factor RimM [Marinibactrum halimedae]